MLCAWSDPGAPETYHQPVFQDCACARKGEGGRLVCSLIIMPTYKLIFFHLRGNAETIRLIFAQAGVEYEDVRLTRRVGKSGPNFSPLHLTTAYLCWI